MTAVLEVGAATIRGPHDVDDERVDAAIDFIDEELALVDEQPVATDDLWRDVVCAAVDGPVASIVLICPTWWAPHRIRRVSDAAQRCATTALVVTRAEAVRATTDEHATVVEIGPDVVVVSAGDDVLAVPRRGDDGRVVTAVADAVGGDTAVVIDAPPDVTGSVELAAATARLLRSIDVAVIRVGRRAVLRAAGGLLTPPAPAVAAPRRHNRHRGAMLSGVVVSVAGLALAVTGLAGTGDRPPPAEPETLLVEGRVGLKVPALWVVERVTDGPGSARVQVDSPSDAATALLVTQSTVAPGTTPARAAATLRAALAAEAPGVFDAFVADDRRAGRAVVSYRENRPGRRIDWVILIDGGVRIGIGCQSPADTDRPIRRACDEAVRSAHAVF